MQNKYAQLISKPTLLKFVKFLVFVMLFLHYQKVFNLGKKISFNGVLGLFLPYVLKKILVKSKFTCSCFLEKEGKYNNGLELLQITSLARICAWAFTRAREKYCNVPWLPKAIYILLRLAELWRYSKMN